MPSRPLSPPPHRHPEPAVLIIRLPLLCLILLATAPVLLAAAPVYRWVDGDGKVHFADRPVGTGAEIVDVDPMTPPDGGADHAATLRRQEKLLNVLRRERERAAWSKGYAARKAETRNTNCAIARRNLKGLRQTPLLYRVDDAGERIYLSDHQRDQEIHKAREAVAAWCD